ncbi:C-glycoside deglycosidase beta subunit domain-containing protein [Cryptosporangium japonicum]
MMPETIIESYSVTGSRARMSVRMPWYRALPLSSVADVRWFLDGEPVPRESITWTVDGTTYALDELPPKHDEWWYVLDSAVIEGDAPVENPTGTAVTIALYIPYITTDHGVLLIEESDSR